MRIEKKGKIDREAFIFCSVSIRYLEKRMLSEEAFLELMETNNLHQIVEVLTMAGYPRIQEGNLRKGTYSSLLDQADIYFFEEAMALSPSVSHSYLDLYALFYDIYNIKNALEKGQNDFPGDFLMIPRERATLYALLAKGVKESDFGKWSPYASFFRMAQKVWAEQGKEALMRYLEHNYWVKMRETARTSGIPFFEQLVQAQIDFYNLMTLFRVKNLLDGEKERKRQQTILASLLEEGGKIPKEEFSPVILQDRPSAKIFWETTPYDTPDLLAAISKITSGENLFLLERAIDDYITEQFLEKQSISYGPEPILGYLYGRKVERYNLKLILSGYFLGLPQEKIRERLRKSYV